MRERRWRPEPWLEPVFVPGAADAGFDGKMTSRDILEPLCVVRALLTRAWLMSVRFRPGTDASGVTGLLANPT